MGKLISENSKVWRSIILFGLIVVFLAGCSFSVGPKDSSSMPSSTESIDSSLFVSTDKGDTWRSLTAVPSTSGRPGSIANLDVNVMTMDPQDSKAIYLASYENGLFYTYDIASGWNQVKSLVKATINDVKVDSKNKCIIYAALANRVYRSDDCSRTFEQIYFDSNTSINVNTLAIDHYNTNNIYIGTSRGEIIKSIDRGSSWRTIQRLDDAISHLLISPSDSRLIFVATAKNNIFSFNSNTATNPANSADLDANFAVDNWTDLNEILRGFDLGSNFKDIIINEKDGAIFIASAKMILRSRDNGFTWENLSLLPPEKDAVINSLAVNPNNSDEIYYATDTAFFRSADAGVTWATKKLPTKRSGRELLIDFNNPNVLYLGTKKL